MSFISIPVQFLECQEAPIEQIFHHPEEGVPKSTQADHDSMYLLSQGPTFRDRRKGWKEENDCQVTAKGMGGKTQQV